MNISTKITLIISCLCLVLLFVLMNQPYYQDALYSPAPVNVSHQGEKKLRKPIRNIKSKLKNIKNCSDCHKPWQPLSNKSCTDCHNRDYFQGYSTETIRDTHWSVHKQFCLSCHTEHSGSQGNLTPVVKVNKFQHKSISGYTDESNKWRVRLKKFHLNENGFQIIPLGCVLCHKESQKEGHPMMTDKRCILCHNDQDWRKSDFTHRGIIKELNKQQLKCQSCHPKGFHIGQGVFNVRKGFDCYGCHTGGFQLRKEFQIFNIIEPKRKE